MTGRSGRGRREIPRWSRRARRASLGVVGAFVVAAVTAIAFLASFLAPMPPDRQDLQARLTPPSWAGGSSRHLLGTDHLGRDVLSRLLHGTRSTLLVAGIAVTLAGGVGTTCGLLAGYYGGRVDAVLSRIMDVQLAIPYMLLAIVIVMLLGPGVVNTIAVLVVGGWVVYARLVRAEVLSLRSQDFVLAARALGNPDFRILLRHVLPNTMSSLVVVATIELANNMLFESSLSFLGLGVRPPLISWGAMLSDGRDYLLVAWWAAVFPGIAITLTIFGINQLGDWLRDLLDPRLRLS
ncbi:MAG: ABC transporter permease [Armatimonadota bacterium]|nr:ABC transporter permease [Armatimonadota bacterium]